MCAKFEYCDLSRYYSTNSTTPPYILTNGTVNTRLFIDKTKNNQYLTKKLKNLVLQNLQPHLQQSPHSRQNALFKIPPTTNLNTTLKHLSHVLPYFHLKQKLPQSKFYFTP